MSNPRGTDGATQDVRYWLTDKGEAAVAQIRSDTNQKDQP